MDITIITTGTLRCRKELLEPGSGNETVSVPVRCILLEHRGKFVLFDTGQLPPEQPQRPDAPFIICVSESESCAARVRGLGIADKIDFIILSHAHRDHSAGLRDFPGMRTLIQRREAESAAGRELLRHYPQQWELIDGKFDIFGDGSAFAVPTYGHTPGHQSLLAGKTLYAIDAAYTSRAAATAAELKEYRDNGFTIVPGHPLE